MFNEFEKTKNWIENIKKFGSRLDLSRISKVLEELGNPQNSFKSIHVAGTNGKGSTASYIKSILLQAGYNVGIYTSPYVVKFNERIAMNDTYISDEDVIKYANIVFPIWENLYKQGDVVTFFEVLTIICFLYFKDKQVDYGVIEVGLGGKLDATNVINPEISVITNISYDHMNVLGNTLEAIALNKLGIVKPNVPLITTVENQDLIPLFKEITKKNKSNLTIIGKDDIEIIEINEITKFKYKDSIYQTNLPGIFQTRNASLAVETILQLKDRLNLKITDNDIKLGLINTKWPGRFEIFNHNIILDGAHNIGGIEALTKTLKRMYPDKYIKALVSIMFDKEHDKIIEVLDNACDEIYFTEFEYARRADAEVLFDESHHLNKRIVKDYKSVFKKLSILKENEILVVTGSLYFISEIRKLLIK